MVRTVKKQATYLGLKYQPQYGWLTINLGAEIFRLFKNSMFIDETPYSDETLVPIKNVTIKNKIFSFESFFKKNDTLFEIDCSSIEGAAELAHLIKVINDLKINFKTNYDPIELIVDDSSDIEFSVGNDQKMLIIYNNQYQRSITKRFPEPSEKYQLNSIYIKIGNLFIDTKEKINYKWNFNLPYPIQDCLERLITIWLQKNYT